MWSCFVLKAISPKTSLSSLGWRHKYNFDQFLQLSAAPGRITADKQDSCERKRNLFYV